MAAVTKSPALRAFWKLHRFLLQLTKGRFFTRMGPGRQLLLVTTGRKSGEPRPVGLTYLEDSGRWIVIGSNLGEDQHPAWWLNLLSNSSATITLDGHTIPVTAQEVDEPDRSRLLNRFVTEVDESYRTYQQRTSRRLPVVALNRITL